MRGLISRTYNCISKVGFIGTSRAQSRCTESKVKGSDWGRPTLLFEPFGGGVSLECVVQGFGLYVTPLFRNLK